MFDLPHPIVIKNPEDVVVRKGVVVPIVVPVVAGSRIRIDCTPVLTNVALVLTVHVPDVTVQLLGGVDAGVASKPQFWPITGAEQHRTKSDKTASEYHVITFSILTMYLIIVGMFFTY